MFNSARILPNEMRKNIVLDMDETLLHTFSTLDNEDVIDIVTDPNKDIASRIYACHVPDLDMQEGSGVNRLIAGVTRPDFEKFMEFCYRNFDSVVVWSAGTNNYVQYVLNEVCSDVGMPDLILSREDCVRVGDRYEKPLRVLSRRYPDLGIDLASTLIVDDREFSFASNQENGVLVTPFLPRKDSKYDSERELVRQPDDVLMQLQDWLEVELLPAADVRDVEKPDF